jgi:hypothetical protein
MMTMRAEDYSERRGEVAGWPVNISSYRADGRYYAKADNVSPGACLARSSAATREQAEAEVLESASRKLSRTRRLT